MAHWLHYHRDRYFGSLSAAVFGAYQREFKEEADVKPSDPETVRAAAVRELDATRVRHSQALDRYQEKKRPRGR